MGKRWAEIARRLPGRSDNAVKNWWNGGMNRRKRAGGHSREAGHERQDSCMTNTLPSFRPEFALPPPVHYPMSDRTPHQFLSPFGLPASSSFNGGMKYEHRPQPLDVRPQNIFLPPCLSPSAQSNVSMNAPSLVSDNGSIKSPLTPIGLPPLPGSREGRRNSEIAYLPSHTTSFVNSEGKFETVKLETKSACHEPVWEPQGASPSERDAQLVDPQLRQVRPREPPVLQFPFPSFDTLRTTTLLEPMESNKSPKSPSLLNILNSSNE